MNNKVAKVFRKVINRVKRTFRRVKKFITGKSEPVMMVDNQEEDPIFSLFPEAFTKDTYTPDPSRRNSDGTQVTGEG
jgi:hypothetical protein